MSATTPVRPELSGRRRWGMLGASTLAQAAAASLVNGPAFLIPALHVERDLSLAQAGMVAAAPTLGLMISLMAWGWLTDRKGERAVLLVGLSVAAASGVLAAIAPDTLSFGLALLLGGCAAASTNAASGRIVVGWFPLHRRGLAMGIRQMAQPMGVGLAAVTLPVVADQHGISAALWIPAGACAVAASVAAIVVADPPRTNIAGGRDANPYRSDSFLARVHGVSVLLVVPQFVVWTFALVWLIQERGWSPAAAGSLVAGAQVLAAFGRIGAGQLSDLVGSRMRPLRWVAVGAAISMFLLAVAAKWDSSMAIALLVVATVVTVADNGLAFTAVAERAGSSWSGRALGAQNTAQNLMATLVPPLGGLAVAGIGYPATFALAAVFPLVATLCVPVRHERNPQ